MSEHAERDVPLMRAFAYGCPARADLDDAGIRQLRLANQLWNALVEAEHAHEDAKAAIWGRDPRVAAAQETLAAAQQAADEIRERIRASRQADRTTVPRDGDKSALAAASSARREAKTALDAARQAALPGLREAFGEAKKARAAAHKALYKTFVQEKGLGWGTHNDIVRRRFPAAVAKVEERRKSGLPAQLRYRRFDGTGTLTVQVQRQAGHPPRTVPALNSGRHPQSGVLALTPWQDMAGRPKGAARHGTLTARIGRGRGFDPLRLEIPVVLDRYLPAGADVCEVKISRRVTGTHARLSVSVVCQVREPAPRGGHADVAVRLGWKSAGDGWTEVAHIGSSDPLPAPPAAIAAITRVSGDGLSADVLYPAEWRKLLERDAAIRSVRDQDLEPVRDKVTVALRQDAVLAESLGVTAGEVSRWRAPRRFAVLARSWPAGHELAPVLEEWRRRDRHLYDYEAHERAQVTARRRDAWRCVAAWLCTAAAGVAVDGLDVAALKREPDVSREDPEQARRGRAQMHAAAPGELRAAVLAAAKARKIPVTVIRRRKDET